jgi:hypothetical protein
VLAGRARAHAARLLEDVIQAFLPLGYHEAGRPGPLEARLERQGSPPLMLRFAQRGKVFGGQIALEVTTAEPVLPATPKGLSAHARGAVRMKGMTFRARGGDANAEALARGLSDNARLGEKLGRVHFDRVRVDANGRPVITQIGGSIVWMVFPPLVRPVPLVRSQAKATAEALEAFAAASPGGGNLDTLRKTE